MAYERRDEFVLEVYNESTFATSEGGSGAALVSIWDLSADGIDYEVIENPAYTTDIADHEPIKGLVYPNASLGFTVHPQGLGGSGAGDTVAATANAVTKLVGGVFGQSPDLSTGDTVQAAPSPTVSQFTEGTDTNHGVGQLVAVGLSTGIEVRPITTYSTAAITLGIKLSAAPSASDVLYGGANLKWSDNPASFYYIQTRVLGADKHLNKECLGQVGNLTIPEVGPNELPTLQFEFKVADFNDVFTDTRTDPSAYRASPLAGGQFIIAAEGVEQDYMRFCTGRISVNFNADYDPVECAHDTASGIAGWRRTKGKPEVTIVLPHDSDPSAAATASGSGGLGLTPDNWRAIWRDESNDDENAFQILAQYGTSAGSIFAFWFRSLYLWGWEEIEVGGIAYQRLTFRRKTGATTPPVVAAQF